MAAEPLRVIIVDDHEVVHEGVRSWCAGADPPIEVVSAGSHIRELWTGAGADAQVVILDLQLSQEKREFDSLQKLVDAGRRVVVYTQESDRRTALQCIRLGALAYVTKSEGKSHLVAAVRSAAAGHPYTPPSLSGAIVADDDPHRPRLSEMELAALRAWFASSSKNLAALALGIKPRTVDTYIERARIKYAAAGRPAPTKSALVARALEDGLIDLTTLGESLHH